MVEPTVRPDGIDATGESSKAALGRPQCRPEQAGRCFEAWEPQAHYDAYVCMAENSSGEFDATGELFTGERSNIRTFGDPLALAPPLTRESQEVDQQWHPKFSRLQPSR
jgi:hypothetical protein